MLLFLLGSYLFNVPLNTFPINPVVGFCIAWWIWETHKSGYSRITINNIRSWKVQGRTINESIDSDGDGCFGLIRKCTEGLWEMVTFKHITSWQCTRRTHKKMNIPERSITWVLFFLLRPEWTEQHKQGREWSVRKLKKQTPAYTGSFIGLVSNRESLECFQKESDVSWPAF